MLVDVDVMAPRVVARVAPREAAARVGDDHHEARIAPIGRTNIGRAAIGRTGISRADIGRARVDGGGPPRASGPMSATKPGVSRFS